ncbi:MAG TPA: nuclear transport factor 2 family protein [Gemmatimonadaceae bacterium]|nr:nuclear transport factor 2 family protein [Gemmatimonadaceae bacterium]
MPTTSRLPTALAAIAAAAVVAIAAAIAPAAAQGTALATGRRDDAGGTRAEAQYMAYISASVDTVLKSWEKAARARNADALSELYASDALLVLSSGRLVRGRGSVRDAYARLLPRLHSARIDLVQIVASADVASVVAELNCEVKLPSGGWYPRVVPMLFTVKADDRGRFHITIQSGGDVQQLAAAPRRRDSLHVVLTDASGVGVPGVLVSFQVEHGPGTVDPIVAVTDADGRAASHLEPGDAAQPSVVRAAAATLLEEPVFFTPAAAGAPDSTPRDEDLPRPPR